jgi:hypothetical protein
VRYWKRKSELAGLKRIEIQEHPPGAEAWAKGKRETILDAER